MELRGMDQGRGQLVHGSVPGSEEAVIGPENVLFSLQDVRTFFEVQGVGLLKRLKGDQGDEDPTQVVADAARELLTQETEGEGLVEAAAQGGREERMPPQLLT